MSEEFGPNFITLTDEDGNEIELEYVDAIEVDGQTYMAFFPTVDDEADEAAAEEFGLVILKSITENGEELLSTLDSDEELNRVYDLFMEQLVKNVTGDNQNTVPRLASACIRRAELVHYIIESGGHGHAPALSDGQRSFLS